MLSTGLSHNVGMGHLLLCHLGCDATLQVTDCGKEIQEYLASILNWQIFLNGTFKWDSPFWCN